MRSTWKFVRGVMPPTRRVLAGHKSSAASALSGGEGGGLRPRIQFPALPKEMEGRYVPGQMYKYQDSLPKLPVPPLQQTLQKYITSVEVGSELFVCLCVPQKLVVCFSRKPHPQSLEL